MEKNFFVCTGMKIFAGWSNRKHIMRLLDEIKGGIDGIWEREASLEVLWKDEHEFWVRNFLWDWNGSPRSLRLENFTVWTVLPASFSIQSSFTSYISKILQEKVALPPQFKDSSSKFAWISIRNSPPTSLVSSKMKNNASCSQYFRCYSKMKFMANLINHFASFFRFLYINVWKSVLGIYCFKWKMKAKNSRLGLGEF